MTTTKRTFDEMMADEDVAKSAAVEATRAVMSSFMHFKDKSVIEPTNAALLEMIERQRVLFAQAGVECRITFFSSPSRAKYNYRVWAPEALKYLCQVHARNYVVVATANANGNTVEELDRLYFQRFRDTLLKKWNNAHPKYPARWEAKHDGSIDLVVQ